MESKIALLDFCGTVVDFQTFDPFILYILKKEAVPIYKVVRNELFRKACAAADRLFCLNQNGRGSFYKIFLVRCLKSIQQSKIQQYGRQYFEEVISGHLIGETMEVIENMQRAGLEIILVSGGCREYIQCFAQEQNIRHIVATELEYGERGCTGRIRKPDCMGKGKVLLLNRYMEENGVGGELYAAVTDSSTDMPILKLCKKAIVISHEKHQRWVTDDMDEIIWGK